MFAMLLVFEKKILTLHQNTVALQIRDRFLHVDSPPVVKPAADERARRQRDRRRKADAPPRAVLKQLQRVPADQQR